MLIVDPRKLIGVVALGSALIVPSLIVNAQKPKPTPSATKAQSDATKPPGNEQNQDPTAPPATQQPAPQAPPGTQPQPAPTGPGTVNTTNQEPQPPSFPAVQQQALPPLPNMTRLGVNSGNVLTLSLNEAIRKALQNNNDIEVARHDVRFAETQLLSFQGVYDPVFLLTPQIDKRNTPTQSIFAGGGTSGTVSNTVYSLTPSVLKSFEKGGGTYQLSFSNSKTVTGATNSTLDPFYSSNLALTFTQPLWRNRAIDSSRHQIRVQKKRVEQSDADFRRATINVISLVQGAYWDLVFAMRDQQIQLDNLNLSRENLRQIEAQIAAGAKAPLDRAEVLTEIANRQTALLTATQTVSIAENTLKQLILKDPTSGEWSAQVTPTDTPTVDTNPVSLDDAITEARKNRPELQRLRLQTKSTIWIWSFSRTKRNRGSICKRRWRLRDWPVPPP
jgi:HAE1 family hydrophobic/amphiphilic exporter-1